MNDMKYRYLLTFKHLCVGLCLTSFVLPLMAQDSLDDLRALKESDATQLALQLMDEQQPDAQTSTEDWMTWERERLQIYEQTADWSALIERTGEFPSNLSSDFLIRARTLRARAFMEKAQPLAAREVLQSLVWLSPSLSAEQNQHWLPLWRHQIIETYLEQGLLQDAYTAEQRYRQDYGILSDADRLLQARILLLNNHVEEATELLSKHTKDPQAGMLYLIAQLRSGERQPKKVLQAALRQLRGKWVNKKLQHRLWAVVVEAARRSGDYYAEVNALEHLVALVTPQQLPRGLFKDMDADGLWQAYSEAALQLGNQQQLLIGDDKSWLNYANEIASSEPLKGRTLYAFIILKGQQADTVNQASKFFLQRSEKLVANNSLVKALFLQSQHFIAEKQISLPIRHALVDIALAEKDIPLASRMMATMQEVPQGVDPYMWQLRRARILIMGGNFESGYQSMEKLLADNPKLERVALDRYLQVVFDLQTLKAHDEAVALFKQVIQYTSDQKLQRELYFWMADSRKAQENYTEAARWYLKSAMLPDAKAMDPWAQAARYQAASALTKAGLTNDAREIYQHLLRVTEDKSRVAVLRRELQQLDMQR